MEEFLTFNATWPWPWPWIGPHSIPSCITHQPLHKHTPNFIWIGETFCRRTDVRTYVQTDGQTSRSALLGRLGGVDLKINHWCCGDCNRFQSLLLRAYCVFDVAKRRGIYYEYFQDERSVAGRSSIIIFIYWCHIIWHQYMNIIIDDRPTTDLSSWKMAIFLQRIIRSTSCLVLYIG